MNLLHFALELREAVVATIVRVNAIPIRIALRKPVTLASETITAAENLVVSVQDSDGRAGWGEAASAPTMTGERLGGMVADMRAVIGPRLVGLDIEDRACWLRALAAVAPVTGSAARASAEIAMHDLLARRMGVSVAGLLGAGWRHPLPLVETLAAEQDIDAAVASGMSHFKVKVGVRALDAEAAMIRRLRSIAGPDCHLSADANMAWTVDEAVRFLNDVEAAELAYLEQPVAADDMAGMAAIARQTRTPLCIDEALHGVGDIERFATSGAASGAGLKLLKLGGYAGAVAAEADARRHGWMTTWASKIAETSIGGAAMLHAACLSQDPSWGVSLTHHRLIDDIVDEPLPWGVPLIAVPEGPGLGVEPDPERLARLRIDQ